MSRKFSIFLIIVFTVILFLIGGGYYFSELILFPNINCNSDHHVFCTDPSELGLQFEEVDIPTSDGLVTKSWFIPGKFQDKAIVVVHGHGGSRNEGLRFAKGLNEIGYNLLLINLRRNSGGEATMGYKESMDVEKAIEFAIEEKKMKHIALLGFSMGSATSILVMARDERVEAGLFSSGYANALDQLTETAKRDFGIPKFPMLYVVQTIVYLRSGTYLDSISPETEITSIGKRPIGIMHCKEDNFVSSSHAYRLQSKATNLKMFYIPNCKDHERIWNFNPKETMTEVSTFYTKNF